MDDKLFSNLKELQKDMLKILGDVTSITSPMSLGEESSVWKPKFDMFETDNSLVIIVDLAGVNKKSIKVLNTDDYIEVAGERIINIECEDACFYNVEIEAGKFYRKIFLPEMNLNRRNPKVKYENGILNIKFEKFERSQTESRTIEVE